jgi:hypothetical protein
MLDQHRRATSDETPSAEANAEILDQDEVIRQERERLKAIQTEWEEKLRQAEVDTSVERAKLARERAQLEGEKQALQAKVARSASQDENDNVEKSGRGRWLARLGLLESEDS